MADAANSPPSPVWHLSRHAPYFFALREVLGRIHGSDEICLLLYSMIKRDKPRVVVELGTGLGVTTAWIAAALRENQVGRIHTYDNGDHYRQEGVQSFISRMEGPLAPLAKLAGNAEFAEFIETLLMLGDVHTEVDFHEAWIERERVLADIKGQPIDFVFSDFNHSPEAIQHIIGGFLPLMSPTSSIFIDSAPTHLPSFHALNQLVGILQSGRIPQSIRQNLSPTELDAAMRLVTTSRFTLQHLVENSNRAQNSTAWLRIETVDMLPPVSTFYH
ncbi:MAG: class I SAM-dependent methyltransferase [Rhodanobacter sp.]